MAASLVTGKHKTTGNNLNPRKLRNGLEFYGTSTQRKTLSGFIGPVSSVAGGMLRGEANHKTWFCF